MKLHIELCKLPWETPNWKTDPPHVLKLCDRMYELFAAYGPKRLAKKPDDADYHTHEMTVEYNDPQVAKLLKQLDAELKKSKPKAAAIYEEFLTPDEVKRARFLELFIYGDDVDENERMEPLNEQAVLCEVCMFPDLEQVPKPLLANKGVLKKQDAFRTGTGMLIVRQHVAELLRAAIPNQIEIGDAVLAGSKKKPAGSERLFWIRLKSMIGEQTEKTMGDRCKACKRITSRYFGETLEKIINKRGPRLHDMRRHVENFGGGNGDLVLLGGFNGRLHDKNLPQRRWWYWPMAISGALFACLKSNGVKGIAVSPGSDPVRCFVSDKAEPMLHDEPRTISAEAKTAKRAAGAKRSAKKPASDSRAAKGRELVASLAKVPWDYDRQGYVYFYLSSPEFIVLDPMTWEDSGGPYKVKSFKKPGLFRIHVSAIKEADGEGQGVAVDSATLLFVDNAFFADLLEVYSWDKSTKSNGALDKTYHAKIAEAIGNRFGVCTTPLKKLKSEFIGDGFYTIDVKQIERAE